MNTPKPQLPTISDEERTTNVDVLLEIVAWQEKRIDELEEQILKLKGETTKPKISPSKMDHEAADTSENPKKGPTRSKTAQLEIDETKILEPETIPEGAVFKGYQKVVVQDIVFKRYSTCY